MLGDSIQVWSKSFGVDLQECLRMWYHTGIAQLENNTDLFELAYIVAERLMHICKCYYMGYICCEPSSLQGKVGNSCQL